MLDGTFFEKHKGNSTIQYCRKRKRKHKVDDSLIGKRQNAIHNNVGIDKLPDEMLISILSRMSLKDAARTSILSSRWRFLWMFISGILEFVDMDTVTGNKIERKKFTAWVNLVLKLHRGRSIDSLNIRFTNLRKQVRSRDIDSWVYFAMKKEVKKFELDLSVQGGFHCNYEFPKIEKLLSRSHEVKSAFGSLRSLRLVDVDIKDEVVQHFLVSSPYLEQLCIRASNATKNLEVVDPLPNLKVLEICDCVNIHSLKISAMNLVSSTYQGSRISSPFKKTPNLTELTLGGVFCESFIYEPIKHLSYSVQLVKLVLNLQTAIHETAIVARSELPQLYSLKRLELNTVSQVGRSLLFFTSLIKASPLLCEFKIKVDYIVASEWDTIRGMMPFPEVTSSKASRFRHENLKLVEMVGYIGCASQKKFLVQLSKIAPSLEMIVIDTHSDYYGNYDLDILTMIRMRRRGQKPWKVGAITRYYAKLLAEKLKLKLTSLSGTKLVIT